MYLSKILKPIDFTGFEGTFCYRTYVSLYGEEMKKYREKLKMLLFRKIPKPLDFTKVTGLFINGTHVSIYGIDNKTVDK